MADGAGGKAQVAREVCAASAAFNSCPHRRRSPRRAPFVDWYLVLSVGEAASDDAVRRRYRHLGTRYRHLALQLHPDKNRHPKAEMAFKIVSEAHSCLTDRARRRAFDAERAAAFCAACHELARGAAPAARHRATEKKALTASDHQHQQKQARGGSGAKQRAGGGGSGRRSPAATDALREVQNRLREECRVIDGCLRANVAGARRRQSYPLFDPSDRQRFPDYPHSRPVPPSTPSACRPGTFWPFEDPGADEDQRGTCESPVYQARTGSCESPVYQVRTAPERAARTKRQW